MDSICSLVRMACIKKSVRRCAGGIRTSVHCSKSDGAILSSTSTIEWRQNGSTVRVPVESCGIYDVLSLRPAFVVEVRLWLIFQ
jgi:hypothetical protein